MSTPAPVKPQLQIVITMGQSLTTGVTASPGVLSSAPEFPNQVLGLNFNSADASINTGWQGTPVDPSTFLGFTPLYEVNSETQLTSMLNRVVADYGAAGQSAPTFLSINTGTGGKSILQLMTPSSEIFSTYATALANTNAGDEFAVASAGNTYDFYTRTQTGAQFFINRPDLPVYFDNLVKEVTLAVQHAQAEGYQVTPNVVFNWEQGQSDANYLGTSGYGQLLSLLEQRVTAAVQQALGSNASLDKVVTQVRGGFSSNPTIQQLDATLNDPSSTFGTSEYQFEAEYPSQVGNDYTHLTPEGYYMLGQTVGDQLFALLNGQKKAPIVMSGVKSLSSTQLLVTFSGVRTSLVSDPSPFKASNLLAPPPNMGFEAYSAHLNNPAALQIVGASLSGANAVTLTFNGPLTGAFRIYLGRTDSTSLFATTGVSATFGGSTLRDASVSAALQPANGQALSDPYVYDYAPVQYLNVIVGPTSALDAVSIAADLLSVTGGALVVPGAQAIVLDTGLALQAMTAGQLAGIKTAGFTGLVSTQGGLTLSVAQVIALQGLGLTIAVPAGVANTVADTAAAIAQLTPAQILGLPTLGITSVGPKGASATLTLAQALALESAGLLLTSPNGTVNAIADKAAAIQSLTAAQIAGLGRLHVKTIIVTDVAPSFTFAAANALLTGKMTLVLPAGTHPTIRDTAATLHTLTSAQIVALAAFGITSFASTDASVALSTAAALQIASSGLAIVAPAVSVSDNAATLSKLTAAQIGALASLGVGALFSTTGNLSLTVAQTSAIGAKSLSVGAASGYTVTQNFANGGYATTSSGILIVQKSVHTDGSFDIAHFNVDRFGALTEIDSFNASSQKTASTTFESDGSRQFRYFDTTGNETAYTTYNTDGSRTFANLDISGKPYTEQVATYDSSGHLLDMTRNYGDAAHTLAFSLVNKPDGETDVSAFDAAGREVLLNVTASDGKRDQYTSIYAGTSTTPFSVEHDHFTALNVRDSTTTTFVFQPHSGQEVITSFHAGAGPNHDTIQFDSAVVPDFAHLQSLFSPAGRDTLISISPTDSLVVKGVAPNALVAQDFTFVHAGSSV